MTTNPFDADRPPERSRRERRRERREGEGGRRRDESLMVPDVEFESYYGRNIVKAPPWKHEIPAYLFLGGLAAGSGARRRRRLGAQPARSSPPRPHRGSRGGRPRRGRPRQGPRTPRPALNMMRTIKLTSPMSVGSWILSAFGAFAGLAVASEAGQAVFDHDSLIARALRVADPPAAIGSALFSAPLAAYTAVLLSDTAAPTWHESYRELPFVFVGSANAAAAGLALVMTPTDQNGPVRKMAVTGAALELGAFEVLKRNMDPLLAEPLHEGKAGRMLKLSEMLTAGGALGALLFGRNRVAAGLSGVALMAGSALTRFGVFEAGMESTKDPKYTVQPQRERLERRRADGVTDDSITTIQ